MKITVKRRIDELGRLVLPKDFRECLGIEAGDLIEFMPTDEGIILKKAESQSEKKESRQRKTESIAVHSDARLGN